MHRLFIWLAALAAVPACTTAPGRAPATTPATAKPNIVLILADDLGYGEGSLPVSEEAGHEVLSLPVYPELTEEQIRTVVDTIGAFL